MKIGWLLAARIEKLVVVAVCRVRCCAGIIIYICEEIEELFEFKLKPDVYIPDTDVKQLFCAKSVCDGGTIYDYCGVMLSGLEGRPPYGIKVG